MSLDVDLREVMFRRTAQEIVIEWETCDDKTFAALLIQVSDNFGQKVASKIKTRSRLLVKRLKYQMDVILSIGNNHLILDTKRSRACVKGNASH